MAERTYLELRDRIVSLRIPPGSLIREEEVMEEFGVSRTPVREAILQLSQDGLMAVIPRRGSFVTDVHIGDVGRIFEFRRELEAVAAGWAAERREASDLPAIHEGIAELKEAEAARGSDLDARSQTVLDQRAHNLIYRLASNPLLESTLSTNYLLAARMWFLASGRVTMEEPFADLIELLEAVIDGDAEKARRLARHHSEAAEATIRAAL
jgi:DNA-binding GntR family transcriptional regulator